MIGTRELGFRTLVYRLGTYRLGTTQGYHLDHSLSLRLFKPSLIMFALNMLDYPIFFLSVCSWILETGTWDFFGTWTRACQ